MCVCVRERERERERMNICVSHFLYSSVNRQLGCFHILAVVNNAAGNMGCRYLFDIVILFPWIKYPEVELLDHTIVLFLIF